MNSSDTELKKGNGLRSRVWSYYNRISNTRVTCVICNNEQSFMGTGNLRRHLRLKHHITIAKQMSSRSMAISPSDISQTNSNRRTKTGRHTKEDSATGNRDGVDDNTELYYDQHAKNGRPATAGKLSKIIKTEYNANASDGKHDGGADNTEPYYDQHADSFHEPSLEIGNRFIPEIRNIKELMEEKIKAETEYFREKAAYYRMQKDLTELQARKVRLELEQMKKSDGIVDYI